MVTRRHFILGVAALAATLPAGAQADLPQRPRDLIRAARRQIGDTVTYDSAYARIAYPNGDVPSERGVCSDVVIRAYRDAFGIDLQRLVHEDMAANFAAYPHNWGLNRPDSNIDHRRVPNLMVFFKRRGAKLPDGTDYQPGDLVTQAVGGRLPHIVILSGDKDRRSGRWQVIHNIGMGTQVADTLDAYPKTGHYRYEMT
ncbi:MAG: DUF1287 domain-containing protein [Pseudomonadota bacterium]